MALRNSTAAHFDEFWSARQNQKRALRTANYLFFTLFSSDKQATSYAVSINSKAFYQGKLMGTDGKTQIFKTPIAFEKEHTRMEFRTFSIATTSIGLYKIQLLRPSN